MTRKTSQYTYGSRTSKPKDAEFGCSELKQLKAHELSWRRAMEECDDTILERENLWIWQEQVEGEYQQALESMYMVAFNACAAAGLPLDNIPFDDDTPPEERQNEETAQKGNVRKKTTQEEDTQEETTQAENTQDEFAQAKNTQ
jgi:hypothetical protein